MHTSFPPLPAKLDSDFVLSNLPFEIGTSNGRCFVKLNKGNFDQLLARNKVEEVHIYGSKDVKVLSKNGLEQRIAAWSIVIPNQQDFSNLVTYLLHARCMISEFYEGGYKLNAHLRLMGGGQTQSSAGKTDQKPKKISPKYDAELAHHVYCNHLDDARKLLAKGANPNAYHDLTRKPVLCVATHHLLANEARREIARLLIKYGADVNAVGKLPEKHRKFRATESALEGACRNNWVDIVKLLLSKGAIADLDHPIFGSLLHLVILDKNLHDGEVAILLIKGGADITKKDRHGQTPLELAMGHGLKNVAEAILNKLNPNNSDSKDVEQEDTPLEPPKRKTRKTQNEGISPINPNALDMGVEFVRKLLEQGANPNTKIEGHSPLHYAVLLKDLEVANLLISSGAKLNSLDQNGKSALILMLYESKAPKSQILKTLRLMIDKGISKRQLSLALQFVILNSEKMAKIMIENGADIDWEEEGLTGLARLCQLNQWDNKSRDKLQAFLKYRASPQKIPQNIYRKLPLDIKMLIDRSVKLDHENSKKKIKSICTLVIGSLQDELTEKVDIQILSNIIGAAIQVCSVIQFIYDAENPDHINRRKNLIDLLAKELNVLLHKKIYFNEKSGLNMEGLGEALMHSISQWKASLEAETGRLIAQEEAAREAKVENARQYQLRQRELDLQQQIEASRKQATVTTQSASQGTHNPFVQPSSTGYSHPTPSDYDRREESVAYQFGKALDEFNHMKHGIEDYLGGVHIGEPQRVHVSGY